VYGIVKCIHNLWCIKASTEGLMYDGDYSLKMLKYCPKCIVCVAK